MLATRALLGYRTVLPGGTLEIQLHNTCFVIPGWALPVPLFLAAAVPLAPARAAPAGYRQRATNALLAGLALLTLLLLAVLGFWAGQGRH